MKNLALVLTTIMLAACGSEPLATSLTQSPDVAPEALSYRVTTYDLLAAPGSRALVAAKVETGDVFRFDVDDADVDFYLHGQLIGTGVTNDDGTAYVEATMPEGAGNYALKAVYRRWSGNGSAVVREEETSFFVTDIDNTISDLDEVMVPVTPNQAIPAIAGAVEGLKRLAASRGVIYLTARDDYLLDKTRQWLALRGFPAGAVFVNDWQLGGASQGDYKERVIRRLKTSFSNIEAGAGENIHDAQAYMNNQMRAYLIGRQMNGATTVSGWDDIVALED